jgi:hypothetical protein
MDDIDLPDIPLSLDRRPAEKNNETIDVGGQSVPDVLPPTKVDDMGASEMQPHPYADMFPLMQAEDLAALVTSIKEDGLEERIVLFKGEILDGRNRHAACIEAEVEPAFVEYGGDDPLGFVLRKNLHRRHLQISQRAMVAAKLATMKQGERTDLEPSANLQKVSVAEAAETLNVSVRSVETAKVVLTKGDDNLIAAVESGGVSVSAAVKQLTQAVKPSTTPISDGEAQCQRLLKLWKKTGEEGRKLFRDEIGATT